MTQNLEEYAEEAAQILKEEIDFEILCSMLGSVGWTKIEMEWPARMNESMAHEIKEWCRANLKGAFHGRSSIWMFAEEKDAVLFSLRWV